MLLNRNLLETVTIISCSGTVSCLLLNLMTNISPLTGIWFCIYVLFLFFVSLTFSFRFIQWLIHLNKPLKYDLEVLCKKYPYLGFLSGLLPRARSVKEVSDFEECREYDTNELSVISTVLERKLVSSWYVPHVSMEIGFPFACKQMLDQMIGKAFQISNKIETKNVYIDMCSILISHLKEYKKAMKRHEKSPTDPIESLYKKSHSIYNNADKKGNSADHCTNVLRVVLKELIPWELWDTPHSELLVRILAKKLDDFIDATLANPVWLNDKLLTMLGKEMTNEPENTQYQFVTEEYPPLNTEVREEINTEVMLHEMNEIQVENELPMVDNTIESARSMITKSTAPMLQRDINEEMPLVADEDPVDEVGTTASEPMDIKLSPVLRQRRGRQGRNEVKIYDRVIEGSVKTWETDVDLQCISLGQDLLASLNGGITLSRLWGQDPSEPDSGRSDQSLWFGEDDQDMELSETSPKTRSPVKKEQSPKPADALLKDLQTTVHQAKTKIGDLQDEAAGMMEGLLDFGIAGLKKGLRFTGLSDDSQDKSPSHHKDKSESVSPPALLEARHRPVTADEKEVFMSSVMEREENGFAADSPRDAPHLVKQQRVASQDSVPSLVRPMLVESPAPLPVVCDSPEPEYEEVADLSTSIARLRGLLQQRAGGEDIWWEGAEETRGRTQQHLSSRPVDTATLADEYDMSSDRGSSPGQTSNNMQRLDKLFQRTVTGVFNSIKTAVGAEGEGAGGGHARDPEPPMLQEWEYVCTSVEHSVGGAVARLVGSRRAFTHVDAALDSLEQLGAAPKSKEVIPEDFEEWLCAMCAGWCAGAEVACAAGLCDSHVAYRIATLLCADVAESLITDWLSQLTCWLRRQVFTTFETLAREEEFTHHTHQATATRPLDLDETCNAILEKIPAAAGVFGEERVSRAVRLCVSGLSHTDVSRDVALRALDALATHFKAAAARREQAFQHN